jgi:hypothetical protein
MAAIPQNTSFQDIEAFHPTVDELQALKRLELETLPISTAIVDHVPHRLYDLGFITKNSNGQLAITPKGLALTRRQ